MRWLFVCALLLAATAHLCAAQLTWTCGDGYTHPLFEQCDPGTRCVHDQAQQLYWSGTGTAPSLVRELTVQLQYAPYDFGGSSTEPMGVYGLQIAQGESVATQQPQTNVVAYGMFCSAPSTTQIVLSLRPVDPAHVNAVKTAYLKWTYGTPNGAPIGLPCTAFLHTTNSTADWPLTAFWARWTGSTLGKQWTYQSAIGVSEHYRMQPNTYCGTVCCSWDCNNTWATVRRTDCTASDGPSVDAQLALPYVCWPNGQCRAASQAPPPQTANTVTGCGDGQVVPPEECDSAMRRVYAINHPLDAVNNASMNFTFHWSPVVPADLANTYRIFDWSFSITLNHLAGPSFVLSAGHTMSFTCTLLDSVTLQLQIEPGTVALDRLTGTYKYTVPAGTDCNNYNWDLSGYLFISVRYRLRTNNPNLPTEYLPTLTNAAYALLPNDYVGTYCCNTSCFITNPDLPCPDDIPMSVPPSSGNFTCTPNTGECINQGITHTPTQTPTHTATSSRTPSNTPTGTRTPTPTSSQTATPTPSSTGTPSQTPSPTGTPTQTPSPTGTPSQTPSETATQSQTGTSSSTATPTQTPSQTGTGTATQTPTSTPSESQTATQTSSATMTPTQTPTSSETSTSTPSNTPSQTPSETPSVTAGASGSTTSSPTQTPTNTATQTGTPTQTQTGTPSITASGTSTQTSTQTPTQTSTGTPSNTATTSQTGTATATQTPSQTATATPTSTGTATGTPSPTGTATGTPSPTGTPTPTSSATQTPTRTPTQTASPSMVRSDSTLVAPSTGTPEPSQLRTTSPTSTSTQTPTSQSRVREITIISSSIGGVVGVAAIAALVGIFARWLFVMVDRERARDQQPLLSNGAAMQLPFDQDLLVQ
jgi:hypothetical protein